MRVAFVTAATPDRLNPMTTLARSLRARGHDVVFISAPDTEPSAQAAQLRKNSSAFRAPLPNHGA
jgi:zeaxanthin glucosyltransferase